MISKLESLGFMSLHTRRIGPCFRCDQEKQTYYVPEMKRWLCEPCYYSVDENEILINYATYNGAENTMSQSDMQSLMARLQALESRNAELETKEKARNANVYISRNGNLTLKFRQLAPRSWIIPSKRDGQAFLRGAEIPCFLNLDPSGTKIVFHAELSVDGSEAQLFRERFVIQQTVTAQRAVQTQDGGDGRRNQSSTPIAPTYVPPTQQAPIPASAPIIPSPEYDMDALVVEAQVLVNQGLYKSLSDAIKGVKKARGIK